MFKNTAIKNAIVRFLTVSFLAMLIPTVPAFASSADYAMIEFGQGEPKLTNISGWIPVGATNAKMHPICIGGQWGYSTDKENKYGKGTNYGVLIDIDDNFMYNLEEPTPLLLTVEYWDGPHPEFPGSFNSETDSEYARIRAHYDAISAPDSITVDGSSFTHLTDDIVIKNRNQWNRTQFIINDFKAGNGIIGGGSWDLTVTDWGGDILLQRNVIYKSIKLEPLDKEIPLRLTDRINFGSVGNLLSVEGGFTEISKTSQTNSTHGGASAVYTDLFDGNLPTEGKVYRATWEGNWFNGGIDGGDFYISDSNGNEKKLFFRGESTTGTNQTNTNKINDRFEYSAGSPVNFKFVMLLDFTLATPTATIDVYDTDKTTLLGTLTANISGLADINKIYYKVWSAGNLDYSRPRTSTLTLEQDFSYSASSEAGDSSEYGNRGKYSIYLPMKNILSDKGINVNWSFEIYSENNILIDEFTYDCSLNASETRTDRVQFNNFGKCGVYTLKSSAEVSYYDAQKEEYVKFYKDFGTENFGVAYINSSDLNDKIGINVHSLSDNLGEEKRIIDMLKKAGYGWVREASGQSLSYNESTGKWVMNSKQLENLKYIHDSGIKVLMQIWGPNWQWKYGTPGGSIPVTDGDREMFGEWCRDLAEQTHEYVDAYEIFNEPCTTMFASDFSGSRAEEYVKALKIARTNIKAVDNSIPIVGMAVSGSYGYDFEDEAYALEAYNYLDIYSIHRYPYQGTPFEKKILVDSGKQASLNHVKEYTGGTNPYQGMWITEFGINSVDTLADGRYTGQTGAPWGDTTWDTSSANYGYQNGVPRRVQARGHVLGYLITSAFDTSFDKLFIHNAIDFKDMTSREDTWGVLNSYTGSEGYTPYSAKPSFIAAAAFNHFIDDSSVVKKVVEKKATRTSGSSTDDAKMYAIWFDNSNNPKFKQDVIMIQSDVTTAEYVDIAFGAYGFNVYDMYGNHLGHMATNSGKASLRITNEPYYLVGEFASCKLSGSTYSNLTTTGEILENCTPGGTKTFNISGMSSSDTVIVDGFETASISGGTVTLKVPEVYSGRTYGHIKVKASDGNLKFFTTVEMRQNTADLHIETSKDHMNIRGMASDGGEAVTAYVTDRNNLPLGIAQTRAKESGVLLMNLTIPDIESKECNVKVFNGNITLQQQILPEFEMSYTCYKNNQLVPLSSLDVASLDEDDTIRLVLNLKNNTGNANPSLVFYGAVYDNNGVLTAAAFDSTATSAWSGNQTSLSVTLSMDNVTNIKTIKFFVWDSTYKPVKTPTKID